MLAVETLAAGDIATAGFTGATIFSPGLTVGIVNAFMLPDRRFSLSSKENEKKKEKREIITNRAETDI